MSPFRGAKTSAETEPAAGNGRRAPAARTWRIRFVTERPEAGKVHREFEHPRRVWAVEAEEASGAASDAGDSSSMGAGAAAEPGATRLLTFIAEPSGSGAPVPPSGGQGTRDPNGAEGALWIDRAGEVLSVGAGVARAWCRNDGRADILSAVIDFVFHEGELRALEGLVAESEQQAEADVPRAHQIRRADRSHWPRMLESSEKLARARLSFARLEPELYRRPGALSKTARAWRARMLRRAGVEDRLEALNDRLEALEEFYDGANQRISDYRWYREGQVMEKSIIGILLVECFLMLGDIAIHFLH